MSVNVPNFITLGQTMYEKSATEIFYTIQYFGAPGNLLGQSSPILALVYDVIPDLSMSQISSVLATSAAKARRFHRQHERQTDKNSKRHVSARRQQTAVNRASIPQAT